MVSRAKDAALKQQVRSSATRQKDRARLEAEAAESASSRVDELIAQARARSAGR